MQTVRLNLILLLIMISSINKSNQSEIQDIVDKVALQFGDELWQLSQAITHPKEIQEVYAKVQVERKNGAAIVKSTVENISNMLQTKIDGVNCIVRAAETAKKEESLTDSLTKYYSSKYSPVIEINESEEPPVNKPAPCLFSHMPQSMYDHMYLHQDRRFRNLFVNTSHSAVYVPTNVFDGAASVMHAINWTHSLDATFVENFRKRPSLSWQYFGSATGILRHFPAQEWEAHTDSNRLKGNSYDSRMSSWYNLATSGSQDIVILLDISGSMRGYNGGKAELTVRQILATLSSNDLFTVLIYPVNHTVVELLHCTKDILIPGTIENVNRFTEAVHHLYPERYADAETTLYAFTRAYKLLQQQKERKRCTVCNQAIAVVTDSLAEDLDVAHIAHKLHNNSDSRAVRIYTFMIGKGLLPDDQQMMTRQLAAFSHGGYTFLNSSLEMVPEAVLRFFDIMQNFHKTKFPPKWSPVAFVDQTENDAVSPRLMITVSAPVFDNIGNKTGFDSRLLGVAGLDVPLDDLKKLTQPYKLGVNGYAFIVSNNGYILLHPDLRPVYKGVLKENYNSIDLTEVEQFDYNRTERDPGSKLIYLRDRLVNSEFGNQTKIPVLFHYDKMRRISQEYQDYYFAPLTNTPFSLGLVLPHAYGNTWIKVGDEIKTNQHMGLNISDFFVGENWKIHPEWVYCKYHYLEGHEFKTPEDELRHFLKKVMEPNWKWSQQYEPEPDQDMKKDEPNCGRKTLDDDAYYCNKELVQLLVFDAKVTNNSFRSWKFASEQEREIIERYNATLRFVATMSGLTRWQFIFGEVEVDTDRVFGDYHTTAIDETWYKSAILQHKMEAESFVYSVPHESDPPEEGELKVTASMAIFPRDRDNETPACVVGYKFFHESMEENLRNMTESNNLNCSSDWNCYILDNNGYILVSLNQNFNGQAFGDVECDVMSTMIDGNIFKRLTVFDPQTLCNSPISSASNMVFSPIHLILLGMKWFIVQIFLGFNLLNANVHAYTEPKHICHPVMHQQQNRVQHATMPCVKKVQLFSLENHQYDSDFVDQISTSSNVKEHYIKKLVKSNLLLVVVRKDDDEIIKLEDIDEDVMSSNLKMNATDNCSNSSVSSSPETIDYNSCSKIEAMKRLPQRRHKN